MSLGQKSFNEQQDKIRPQEEVGSTTSEERPQMNFELTLNYSRYD